MNKMVWNHNYAYHKWIKKNIKSDSVILDVGCGNGTLIFELANSHKKIYGIDINLETIKNAKRNNEYKNVFFINDNFLNYDFENIKFDCIIFVASIHHMNMEKALIKSMNLLNENGKIIIVGLSRPSTVLDYIVEIMRVVPSFIISKIKNNKPSEKLNIDTSYNFPTLNDVKMVCKKVLKKNFKIRYALHYRYLLIWDKE